MTWLLPIGFLGLIGVALLIVIYIIKPNYQNKYVSTTFVWKLSLKYKKNRLPISRLNNIVTFICQLLILTVCALLMAKPVTEFEMRGDESEKILIIDASASMLVSDGETTRFERAVEKAKASAQQTVEDGGIVSVILADAAPDMLIQRADAASADEIAQKLDGLVADTGACSYSSADMHSAVSLAEEVLRSNSEAQVYLYTATNYIEKNGIIIENVSSENKWNAAVLNVTAEMNANNHFEISVDLGCYEKTEMLTVYCVVHGANGKTEKMEPVSKAEFFDPSEEEKTVVFTTDDFGGDPLYSYDYIEVYVSVSDSFADDNFFFLYGGKKQTIRIQYASSSPNNYFGGVVRTIRENMKGKWNIEYTELKADETPATTGFDFYIFEHKMPATVPTDGLVLLVDPESAPEGAGFRVGQPVSVNSASTLASGAPHELTKHVDSNRVTIAKYNQIVDYDLVYEELAYYNGKPVMLVKDEPGAKVVVWAFDLNYSNIIALPDFSFLMYNMFNHFIPSTFSSNAYEIGDTVELSARGSDLKVSGGGADVEFETNTGELVLTTPGTYTVTQKPMQGDAHIIESFFVRVPVCESDINRQVDELPMIDADEITSVGYKDLIFYFALALVSLMLVEWALQIKKNF